MLLNHLAFVLLLGYADLTVLVLRAREQPRQREGNTGTQQGAPEPAVHGKLLMFD
jgi:hypothetical protein